MDPISYGVAAKQKQRIEKVIAEPDSTSGVITVPKVIAAGETITIPEGRVAILPNVQIDGTLDIQGEVFIPSGATTSSVVEKVTSTDNAIVRFDGTTGDVQNSTVTISDNGNINFPTGARITGDFSNATDSSRVAFESNVLNSYTVVSSFPNGTGALSSFRAFNTQSGLNSSFTEVYCDPAQSMVRAGRSGTGSYLPMTFNTNGAERMRIDTAGNVLVTGSGGLGYGTGSGGTVTQLTNKSTAVTLNKPTGQITMHNASLAAGEVVYFRLNNNLITFTDTIITTFKDGTATNVLMYRVEAITQGPGYCWIKVTNTNSVALAESPVITFAVIKGASA